MKIAVCLKEVLDARLPVQVEAASGAVRQSGTEPVLVLNPADRGALEAAMQLRESDPNWRVEAFSVGDASGEEALWFARARGADHVERLEYSAAASAPHLTAALLASRFESAGFDLICCGDETLDNASAIVGPLLAEILDLPLVTGVIRIVGRSGNHFTVERSLEHGSRELVEMDLPGLITVKPEGVRPRYVSFRKLEAAKAQAVPGQFCEYRDGRWTLPRWPEQSKRVPPRARVKKGFMPDAKITPAERVRMIMAGGAVPQESKSKSSLIEGEPDYVSDQLYRFLKHHEFV